MPISPSKSTKKRSSVTSNDDRDCISARRRSNARNERQRGQRLNDFGTGRGRLVPGASNSGRKRFGTLPPRLLSDSESDLDCISTCTDLSSSSDGNKQLHSLRNRTVQHRPLGLRKSLSQKELKTYDECSSQYSVLTDEEGGDAVSSKRETRGTIQAVYTRKKDLHLVGNNDEDELFEAMSEESPQAVNETRLDLLHAMEKSETSALANIKYIQLSNYIVHQAFSANEVNHMTEMDQLAKRNSGLLAEITSGEQHGGELSNAITSLLSDSMVAEKTSGRRTADERNILIEEADRIIEDFIANVEDTGISLIDGEGSDGSSSLRGTMRQGAYCGPTSLESLPADTDGIVLPWLQWETCDDNSLSYDKKKEPSLSTRNFTRDARQFL